MLGSVAGSAPSTGCFLLEHLRERVGKTERERKSILMKTKMVNKMPERHSFLMLNNSIDLLNELVSRSLAQGTKSYLLKEDKGQ